MDSLCGGPHIAYHRSHYKGVPVMIEFLLILIDYACVPLSLENRNEPHT